MILLTIFPLADAFSHTGVFFIFRDGGLDGSVNMRLLQDLN
jgi:hypothetical protein